MRVRFSRRALRDLAEIADYIRANDPTAATKVRAAIVTSLDTLAKFPLAGRRQSVGGIRMYVTVPYRYLVYYEVDEVTEEIRIASIRHPARRRPTV